MENFKRVWPNLFAYIVNLIFGGGIGFIDSLLQNYLDLLHSSDINGLNIVLKFGDLVREIVKHDLLSHKKLIKKNNAWLKKHVSDDDHF
jgi:hypothetical protein